MSRLVIALLALTVMAGCVEKRTVYRDRGGYIPRQEGSRDTDVYAGRGRVVCDQGDKVCYKNGRPSRDATKDMYGKKAARRWWE